MTSSNPIAPAPGLDVSVVIPVCNEQDNVLPLAREIHAALAGRYRYATIFVDDGSTDGTAEAVRAARRDGMPEIRLIHHSVRSGQSAAVATGVREARVRRAIFERRPIALNVPIDFEWEDVAYEPVTFKLPEMRALVPVSADLDDAVGIIATAKRLILLAGRGAMHAEARQALLRLAGRTSALLATTLRAKDLFRGEAFNLGLFGTLSTPVAVDLIAQSDCIMAFGASLNKLTSDQGALLKGKRVVQCNLEAVEIGKHACHTAGLVGDPGLVADAIIRWLDEAVVVASGFRSDEIERQIKAYSPAADGKDLSTATTIDMRKALM